MTVFELVAKLTLDSSEYEKDLQKQSESGSKLAGVWGKFGTAMKVGAAAVGAASVAVGALTKKSIDAYAEYEQLAGGVKKLFGDEASAEVMKYAENAYKTAGMSANQYMEQATQFSAALINSLGGDQMKAAEQTDVAMRAISDNFNTFGGDIQNVQNAFSGFAKGQFMMLDNLKLGYGGTRGEMQRLIDDANEYAKANGMAADLTIDSFSDIVTAIDLVQQKQGIAGTTAAEAAKTIEGSLNMTKAAWQNLIAGFANPDADMGQLMDNLIVAILGDKKGEGLLNQLVPAVKRAIEGIGTFIQAAVPALADKLPSLIQSFVPVLIQSAVTLVTSLAKALPNIFETLAEMAPDLIGMVVDGLVSAIISTAPILVKQAPKLVKAIAKGIINSIGTVGAAAKKLLNTLDNAIYSGIIAVGKKAGATIKKIPAAIKAGLGNLRSVGSNLIEGLWGGIKAKFDGVISRVKSLAAGLPTAVKKVLGIASPSKVFRDQIGKNISLGIAAGIEDGERDVRNALGSLTNATIDAGAAVTVSGTGALSTSRGGDVFNINLGYNADADATDMLRDLARGVQRYRMAGAI